MRLGIDKSNDIIFVPDSDGLTIRAPADVDILTWKMNLKVSLGQVFQGSTLTFR